ncbi:MAG: helix-turn-helix transcriptional regulator [Bacteroidales bacterium]|nr:helix-turn-helix transcriptional regulator [Bacteroidales bacterium]
MNRRLQQFLSAENISQAQFADSIEVARASVSHVLAGRNKPGYDFIRSISEHYPKLNLEWLISGRGKMYKQDSPSSLQTSVQPVEETAGDTLFGEGLFGSQELENEPVAQEQGSHSAPLSTTAATNTPESKERSITRIIVFYDDNTFQELK